MTHYIINSKKDLPGSEIELDIEIPAEELERGRSLALKKIKSDIELRGFRKGNAPEALVIREVGENRLLEEAVEIILRDLYPLILEKEEIDALGEPQITLTKIAIGNPLMLRLRTAVVPQVNLPHYRAIASRENLVKEEQPTVEEKELDELITEIRRRRGGEGATHSSSVHEVPEPLLPFTDEVARSLGNFSSVADLKQKLKEGLMEEKKLRARERRRVRIVDRILKETTFTMPAILIEAELNRMEAQLRRDVKEHGSKFDEYLKGIGKNIDAVRLEWRVLAEKRARVELILREIARRENIQAEESEIESGLNTILKDLKNLDPVKMRLYLVSLITKEKVFELLERER